MALSTVSHEIPWPVDARSVARNLSAFAASEKRSRSTLGWFWLDGSYDKSSSYLGLSLEVLEANPGQEKQFLAELQTSAKQQTQSQSQAHITKLAVPTTGLQSGWVVAFGYEFGVGLLGVEPAEDTAPPAFALRTGVVLELNHRAGTATLSGPSHSEIQQWIKRFVDAPDQIRSAEPVAVSMGVAPQRHPPEQLPQHPQQHQQRHPRRKLVWRHTDAEYAEHVHDCQKAIEAGEAYVLCLTDTAVSDAIDVDPLRLFDRIGVAAKRAIIVAGNRALLSVSPERFLQVIGTQAITHPIKGTRARLIEPALDQQTAHELQHDAKERAENLMIVDLMRNDFSRVCLPGSVHTTSFLRVEQHPHVHQLVSTVQGTLAPGSDVYALIEATMPGGSMTGAPKYRSVELLQNLESGPRGLYSGCFGWIDFRGDADLAMTIRGIELRDLGTPAATARIGAGGGITIDSDPLQETAEKSLKAAPLIEALYDYR